MLIRTPEGPMPVLGLIREAMRDEKALHITYADERGRESEREVWPVQMAYYEGKQIIAAWCTVREAFRHFRTDRIVRAAATSNRFGRRRLQLVKEWRDEWQRRSPDPTA